MRLLGDLRGVLQSTNRSPMNRRVIRQILIALGIFAGIILVFFLIAQLG
jgi:cell division septal protein FtsQ